MSFEAFPDEKDFKAELEQSLLNSERLRKSNSELSSSSIISKKSQHVGEADTNSSISSVDDKQQDPKDASISIEIKNSNVELIPTNRLASFDIEVENGGKADLLDVSISCKLKVI